MDESKGIISDQTEWRDVPEAAIRAWAAVFQASREGVDLSAPCPVCGVCALHRWFNRGQPVEVVLHGQRYDARGGEWEWCSHCRSYSHYSVFVPDWWATAITIPLSRLAHHPGPIEAVLQQRRPARAQQE